MGWETAAQTGFSLLSASNKLDQGNDQANAIAQEGNEKSQDIADNTLRSVGKLQSSFLQSGLTLDAGTQNIINQAFAKGTTDIGRTVDNANNASKNAYNTARTAALTTLASGAVSTAGGGAKVGGFLDSTTSSLVNNGIGQTVGSWLDPSPTGPYLPPSALQ